VAGLLGSRVAVIGAGSLLAGAFGAGAGGLLLADVDEATSVGTGSCAGGGECLFAAGAVGLMADVSEVVRLLGRADGWATGAGAGSPVPVVRLRMRSICSGARPAKMLGLMSIPQDWIRSSRS
jgi:hypothetical protein